MSTPGALRLKGDSSKISKHKKKKPKPPPPDNANGPMASDAAKKESAGDPQKDAEPNPQHDDSNEEQDTTPVAGKTEAELRHEERRRRRLDDRLKREGAKTHKQRVEELNRYLSNLSEHHDMPRIGPG